MIFLVVSLHLYDVWKSVLQSVYLTVIKNANSCYFFFCNARELIVCLMVSMGSVHYLNKHDSPEGSSPESFDSIEVIEGG